MRLPQRWRRPGGLVAALEEQRDLLIAQAGPAERIAEVEGRITAEKVRQVELQRALQAEQALQAVREATEVTLPGLGDKLAATREERARVGQQLDVGTRSGQRFGQGARRLTPEDRVERETRTLMLDAEIAGLETKVETVGLEARANLELLAGEDVDPRLHAAGGAAARAFGEAFRKSAPELQDAALAAFDAAFGPVLPKSDARIGVFSGLTRAGEAVGVTLAEGLRRAAPAMTAAMAGIALLPDMEPVRRLVEVEADTARVVEGRRGIGGLAAGNPRAPRGRASGPEGGRARGGRASPRAGTDDRADSLGGRSRPRHVPSTARYLRPGELRSGRPDTARHSQFRAAYGLPRSRPDGFGSSPPRRGGGSGAHHTGYASYRRDQDFNRRDGSGGYRLANP